MPIPRRSRWLLFPVLLYLILCTVGGINLADATLHPARRPLTETEASEFRQSTQTPEADLHDVSITTSDGATLRGWEVNPHHDNGNAVILLHGLGDNRLGMTGYAQLLLAHGFTVLLPDARAHGISGGSLATYGLLERNDIHQWFDFLNARDHPRCIFGFAESMGAAQLLQSLATHSHFCAVAAESSFATFREIAYDRMGQPFRLGPWVGRTILRPLVEVAFLRARWKYHLDMRQVSPELRREHNNPRSPDSRPTGQQHPGTPLGPDPRAQPEHTALGSSRHRPLRRHQHRSARIRAPPAGMVSKHVAPDAFVRGPQGGRMRPPLHESATASDKPLRPSSQTPPSPSPTRPPTDPPARPRYRPTSPPQRSPPNLSCRAAPPPSPSPLELPAPESSQTSPSTKIPSPDSPSSQTRPHPSQTQSSRPPSSPAETSLHESESSSPTPEPLPPPAPALHIPPQKLSARKKSPAPPSSSSLPRRCSSRVRSYPLLPRPSCVPRSAPWHATPLCAAHDALRPQSPATRPT